MVGGDRNLFVRKGGAGQKKIGKHCCSISTYWQDNLPLFLQF